jgi:hypothetical protein
MESASTPHMQNTARWNLPVYGAWLVLLVSLLLIGLSVIVTVYRFTLPTDGWLQGFGDFGSVDEDHLIYEANLLGLRSALEPGDRVTAIAGFPTTGDYRELSPGLAGALRQLQAGDSVDYTVLRGAQQQTVRVPIGQWTADGWLRRLLSSPSQLINTLGALILLAVAFFTFLRRSDTPSAWALLVLCAAVFANAYSSSLPDGYFDYLPSLSRYGVAFFSYEIFGVVLAPSLLTFSLLFPRPKGALRRWPWLALLPGGLGVGILILLKSGGPPELGWGATLLMFLGSLAGLAHSGLTQRDAISQAQMRWAVGGSTVGLALALLTFLPAFNLVTGTLGEILGSGFNVGITVIGICLAVAVLRYRLFDIDLIIRRTLVYTTLTGTLALVYLGGVLLLKSALPTQDQLATVLSTLAIAALFSPLRRRIQGNIDRLFYRRRYDAEHTLAEFSLASRELVNLEELSASLLNAVEHTLQPSQLSLWIRNTEETTLEHSNV